MARKLKEWRLAIGLEKRWTKQQILEGYLNIAYFGDGAYGVEAASRRYFGRSAAQAHARPSGPARRHRPAPVAYDPLRNPKSAAGAPRRRPGADARAGHRSARRSTRRPSRPRWPTRCTRSVLRNGCSRRLRARTSATTSTRSILHDPIFGKTAGRARRRSSSAAASMIRTTLDPKIQKAAQQGGRPRDPERQEPGKKTAAVTSSSRAPGAILAMAQDRTCGAPRTTRQSPRSTTPSTPEVRRLGRVPDRVDVQGLHPRGAAEEGNTLSDTDRRLAPEALPVGELHRLRRAARS